MTVEAAKQVGASGWESRGDEEAQAAWVRELTRKPTMWQRVIHGATEALRSHYAEWLLGQGLTSRAGRYAMCGMGDEVLEVVGGRYRVGPRRCGSRFCPRCSRHAGLRFVRHVTEHLRGGRHGSVHHMVLTQVVKPRETLVASRERFERKWRRMWVWLEEVGLLSGLRTTHITWSRHGGWHVHAHVIVEFGHGVEDGEERLEIVIGRWRTKVGAEGNGVAAEMYTRELCPGGEAFGCEEEDQGEFWAESADAVEKVVQYCVRDVCQGVEQWHLESAGKRAEELFGGVGNAKLHRLLGEWRRGVKERFGEREEAKELAPIGAGDVDIIGGELSLGTVDSVYYRAVGGEQMAKEILRWLVQNVNNMSLMSRRLVEMFGAVVF